MKKQLLSNGEYVQILNHKIHVYRIGNESRQKIIIMSGAGVPAPVYDYKILYEKLSEKYRIIIIEKCGILALYSLL